MNDISDKIKCVVVDNQFIQMIRGDYVSFIEECFHRVLDRVYALSVFPLKILFFRGPRLWGYGFGEGSTHEDMCQAYTNVRSEFWTSSFATQTECFEILEKKFNGFVVGTVALTAFAVCFQTVYLTINKYFLLRPLNEVNRNLEILVDLAKKDTKSPPINAR